MGPPTRVFTEGEVDGSARPSSAAASWASCSLPHACIFRTEKGGCAMRQIRWVALAAIVTLVPAGVATAIGEGRGTERVVASFEARSVGDPNIKSCKEIPDGTYRQFEATYVGSLTTDREEVFEFDHRGLEILVDMETGLGVAEDTWTLTSTDRGQRGSGELVAVFIGDPDQIGDPTLFAGELQGMFIGGYEDPNERRVIWNFSARLTDGGQALTGAIGDPNVAPNPAILIT